MTYFNENFHFALIWRSGRDRCKPVIFKAQEMVMVFGGRRRCTTKNKGWSWKRPEFTPNGNGEFYYYSREWRNNDGERVKDKKNEAIIDSQQNVIGWDNSGKLSVIQGNKFKTKKYRRETTVILKKTKLISTNGLRRDI